MTNPIVGVACPAITFTIPPLEDNWGNPILGATWTDGGSLKPDRTSWNPSAFIDDAGSNIYWLVGYTFTSADEWLLVATPNGDDTLTITFAITVVAASVTPPDAQTIVSAVLEASVTGYGANTLGGKIARIGTLNVVTGPVDPMSVDRTIIYGDEETLTWSNDTWSIAADATVQMSAYYAGVTTLFDGTRVNATTVSVALTAEQTGTLIPGRGHYRYSVKANADVLVAGNMSVERS